MMLYNSTKQWFAFLKETDFFDIISRVLQIDIFAQYLFIISQYNVLQTSIDLIKKIGVTLKKSKK